MFNHDIIGNAVITAVQIDSTQGRSSGTVSVYNGTTRSLCSRSINNN